MSEETKEKISNKKSMPSQNSEVNFFDLPISKQEEIVRKAAELSAKDQRAMLEEYDRKFGKLQTNTCK